MLKLLIRNPVVRAGSVVALILMIIIGVLATLQGASSDPDTDPLAAVLQQERDRRDDALARGTPPPFFRGPPPTPWTPAPLVTGIFDIDQPILPGAITVYLNGWRGVVDGNYIETYAGGFKENLQELVGPEVEYGSDDGIVMVEVSSLTRERIPGGGSYLAPGSPGRLEIVEEKNGILSLTSDSGTRFLFDVRSRLFINPETGEEYPPAATPAATPSPYHPASVASVRIDAYPGTNTAKALGPADVCAAGHGGELIVDVTVDAIPAYIPDTEAGGITAFSFVLEFMSDFVSVAAVNPGGDADTILASGGASDLVTFIDGDASSPGLDPLPATRGSIQVDIADLSGNREGGSGLLARLRLVAASDLDVAWSNLTLRDVHLIEDPQSGREYSIESLGVAQVTFGGDCP
jgi:hypothetical protein